MESPSSGLKLTSIYILLLFKFATMILMILFTLLIHAQTVYDFHPLTIDGRKADFSVYKGRKILIVNTASECGNTPQYADLEILSNRYTGRLVVIAFPANNFGQQEPGSNEEIADFCRNKYGITFPMMAKVSVKGDDIDPLFAWLIAQQNPDKLGDIRWNFEKFLIDENGNLIRRFHDKLSPLDETIIRAIEE
jgi:glutathione peroxidase